MNRTRFFLALLCIGGLLVAPRVESIELRIATDAPENTDWVRALRAGADEIAARTNGEVTIRYFPGGTQGTASKVLGKMRFGQLHGGTFTASAMNDVYPDINLYSLPLVFQTNEEAAYVRERMDQVLIDGLADKGFVCFGFATTGFAMVMGNEPVLSVDDLRGKKVWVPEGDEVSFEAMKALSVSPQPLPLSDVYTSLQTNNIDIVTVSPIGALLLQWFTQVDYVTNLPIVYTFGYTVIDKKTFDKIDPAHQQVVREVMAGIYADFDESNVVDNDEALAAILEEGLELVDVKEEDVEELRSTMASANRELAEKGVVSLDLYEAMLGFQQEYWSGQAGGDKSGVE